MRKKGRLEDKVALIIGAGSGIGAASAQLFFQEGARLALADIDVSAVQAVAAATGADEAQVRAFPVDVTQDGAVGAFLDEVLAHFGGLHVLFNTAGGSLPEDAPVTEVDLAVWDKTMRLDLLGTMIACRHAIPHIVASGGGSVVNMSSGAALRGSGKAHIYASAKGAIVSLTRNLAGEFARSAVRVNAICCGRINTQRIRDTYGIPGAPGKSVDAMKVDELVKDYPFWFGEPLDVAHIALFLASDESRMITGSAIAADGGRSAY